jgi:hypothetical protein
MGLAFEVSRGYPSKGVSGLQGRGTKWTATGSEATEVFEANKEGDSTIFTIW